MAGLLIQQPSFAKASEGILLRMIVRALSCEAPEEPMAGLLIQQPSFAKASEGILLRMIVRALSCEAPEERSRMVGGEGFEPPTPWV